MSKQSDAVKAWRKRIKNKIVESMGGCCQICDYNKCYSALELHHINPNEKDFSFGSIMARPRKINLLVDELKKCILLCANCHREIHNYVVELPEKYATLDEVFFLRNLFPKKEKIKKPRPRKIFLNVEELNVMLREQFKGNKSALARSLSVSETSIRKKLNSQVAQQ